MALRDSTTGAYSLRPKNVLFFALLGCVVWSALIGFSLWRTKAYRDRQSLEHAASQAKAHFEAVQVLHLAGQTKGLEATYGEITVRWKGMPGSKGSRAPDAWEQGAFASLESGKSHIHEVLPMYGQDYLRWMAPVHHEADCRRCHTEFDLPIGEMRGGVSVLVPMNQVRAISESSWQRQILAHSLGWILGLTTLGLGCYALMRGLEDRDRVTRDLENALRSNEVILENAPVGMVIVDRKKIVRQVNAYAEKILGVPRSQTVGRRCFESFCPAESDLCPVLDLKGTMENSERFVLDQDGNRIPVHKSVIPITWKGEEVLLEAFVNISDQKQLMIEQRALLKEEQRLNRLSIGREKRMVQLKSEVNQLLEEAGNEPRYRKSQLAEDLLDPVEVQK